MILKKEETTWYSNDESPLELPDYDPLALYLVQDIAGVINTCTFADYSAHTRNCKWRTTGGTNISYSVGWCVRPKGIDHKNIRAAKAKYDITEAWLTPDGKFRERVSKIIDELMKE